MRKTRGLVIVPFDAPGERVLDSVRRALQDLSVEAFRFDDIEHGASWANAITDAVRSSDFLVEDVTRQNPNVFYELGFAHALRKPTILIVSPEASGALPSDLEGFQCIVYDLSNLRGLVDRVQRRAWGQALRYDISPGADVHPPASRAGGVMSEGPAPFSPTWGDRPRTVGVVPGAALDTGLGGSRLDRGGGLSSVDASCPVSRFDAMSLLPVDQVAQNAIRQGLTPFVPPQAGRFPPHSGRHQSLSQYIVGLGNVLCGRKRSVFADSSGLHNHR